MKVKIVKLIIHSKKMYEINEVQKKRYLNERGSELIRI